MAARYLSQFYSAYTESQYSVIIYDLDYDGSTELITLADCQLSYPAGNVGRFDTILASELTIKIVINTTQLDAFVEELAAAREGKFLIALTQGITPLFIGYMLMDLVQQEDTTIEVGYILELKATDGLARLKTIDYNDNGVAYTGEDTVIDHILNCLNKLDDVLTFYGTSTWLLRTRINWIAQQHPFAAEADDPAQETRIPHRAFYTIDSRGNYKYKSCFDVLQEICKAFGARMLYANYAFWFIQINEYENPENLKIWNYTKSGTQTSSTGVNLALEHVQDDDTSDLVRLAGGVFRFYPPLQKVQVDYRHIATENLLSWWNTGNAPTGIILDDFQQTARLFFTSRFVFSISSMFNPGDLPLWVSFDLLVRVGDAYLERTGSIVGGLPSYGPVGWRFDNTARYKIFALAVQEDVDEIFDFSFISPVLPSGGGEFEFNQFQGQTFKQDGTLYTDIAIILTTLQSPYMELLYEGTLQSQSDLRRFVSVNNSPGNSAMIDLETIIGDGIGTNSPGHLEVYDGAAWVLASGWNVGASGSYLDFSGLLAQEIIRGQLRPVRRYFGRYHNRAKAFYQAHQVIDHASGYMVFTGGTFRPSLDEVDGEWFYITPETTGWTNEPYLDIPGDQSANAGRPSSGGSGSGGGGNVTPMRIFRQEFTGLTGTTATVTVNGGVLPSNEAAIFITLNGQTLSGDDWSVSSSVITFSFTLQATDIINLTFFIQ